MTMRKLLAISIFCAGLLNLVQAQSKKDCSGFSVSTEISKNNPSDSFAMVTIEVKGSKEPVKCIFFQITGKLVSDDFDKKSFDRVAKGDYRMVVVTASGCREELQIRVE